VIAGASILQRKPMQLQRITPSYVQEERIDETNFVSRFRFRLISSFCSRLIVSPSLHLTFLLSQSPNYPKHGVGDTIMGYKVKACHIAKNWVKSLDIESNIVVWDKTMDITMG